MTETLAILNAAILLGASRSTGTGVSLVCFQFPGADTLTPDNYYDQFVPQVGAATRFFTWMTRVMLLSAALMVWSEWGEVGVVAPLLVLLLVTVATVLTVLRIFRYNRAMASRITDPDELRTVLRAWMRLNRKRVAIWIAEWLAMAAWFAARVA